MKTRYVIILCVASCAIGAIFYPTKTVIKKVEVSNEKDTKLIEDLKSQVNSLTHQNKKLAERTHTIIIEKADGSKRTEIKTESELYETKTKEIKEEYERQLTEAKKEISELKEKEKVEINKKAIGVELGSNFIDSFYNHNTYDVFGPIFIGTHMQLDFKNKKCVQEKDGNTVSLKCGPNVFFGAGVGLRL